MPGETDLAEWGIRMEATILSRTMADPTGSKADRVCIDWKQVHPPLQVRSWRPGDRFRPWGLKGSKKLQDLFVDAKIPREEREQIPVVMDQKGIVWVPGFRIDERAGIGSTSEEVLVLAVHRGEGTTIL